MKTIVLLMATIAAILMLTACNTIEGVGEDVEATGDAVSDAANAAKN